jgi:hypothetical protein
MVKKYGVEVIFSDTITVLNVYNNLIAYSGVIGGGTDRHNGSLISLFSSLRKVG